MNKDFCPSAVRGPSMVWITVHTTALRVLRSPRRLANAQDFFSCLPLLCWYRYRLRQQQQQEQSPRSLGWSARAKKPVAKLDDDDDDDDVDDDARNHRHSSVRRTREPTLDSKREDQAQSQDALQTVPTVPTAHLRPSESVLEQTSRPDQGPRSSLIVSRWPVTRARSGQHSGPVSFSTILINIVIIQEVI